MVIRKVKNSISSKLRHKKFEFLFCDDFETLLDIGVWTKQPEPHPQENLLEKLEVKNTIIIAVGLDNMVLFKKKYPHVLSIQADGTMLPLKNRSVDISIANAVLEHIGNGNTLFFIREMIRVSKKYLFLSVPDRLCLFEVHSNLPFLHWFPIWRKLFCLLGKQFWADPENLQLYSKKKLKRMLKLADPHIKWKIQRQYFGPFPVSLLIKGFINP